MNRTHNEKQWMDNNMKGNIKGKARKGRLRTPFLK